MLLVCMVVVSSRRRGAMLLYIGFWLKHKKAEIAEPLFYDIIGADCSTVLSCTEVAGRARGAPPVASAARGGGAGRQSSGAGLGEPARRRRQRRQHYCIQSVGKPLLALYIYILVSP